jgi:putative solute:sodium symporter small subunit
LNAKPGCGCAARPHEVLRRAGAAAARPSLRCRWAPDLAIPAKGSFFNNEVHKMKVSENHQRYWQKNLRITGILLGIWFVVTYVMAFFARDLNFNFFGWPFSFYMAAQGSLVIYVLIIAFYASYMNKLDIEHGVAEEE